MNRVLVRLPKRLTRRPYGARRAPRRDDVVASVVDARPAPVGLVVLVGVVGALVLVELVVALVVFL